MSEGRSAPRASEVAAMFGGSTTRFFLAAVPQHAIACTGAALPAAHEMVVVVASALAQTAIHRDLGGRAA